MEPFIYVAIFMYVFNILLGIPSNIVILYIYGKKKSRPASHVFIIGHAVVDLIICSTVYPIGVGQWLTLEDFRSIFLCKTLMWVNQSAPLASLHVNTVVAFNRYFAVTRPHFRMLRGQKRPAAIVICVILLAFLVNIPQLIWRRIRDVVHEGESPCHFPDEGVFRVIFVYIVGGMIYIILITTTIYLYAQVYRRVKSLRKNRVRCLTESTRGGTGSTGGFFSKRPVGSGSVQSELFGGNSCNTETDVFAATSTVQVTADNAHFRSKRKYVQSVEQALSSSTFRMLFIVTVIFIFSWFLQMILRLIPKSVLINLRGNFPAVYAIYTFFVLLITVNSSINVLIYAVVNRDFRSDLIKIWTNISSTFEHKVGHVVST